MAVRSFVEEVKKLRLGAGEVFSGEGSHAAVLCPSFYRAEIGWPQLD